MDFWLGIDGERLPNLEAVPHSVLQIQNRDGVAAPDANIFRQNTVSLYSVD